MINHKQSFLTALQFLTTLPVKLSEPIDAKNQGYSLVYYPLIGLIIAGILLMTIFSLQSQSSWVISSLTLTVWVVLTGALHLDGLADSADAWLGGLGNKDKTLTIMKDPASGPIAVITLIIILLVKFVMLAELIQQQQWISILAAPVLARSALPLLLITTPYVRQAGLASTLVNNLPLQPTKKMLLLVGVIALFTVKLLPLFLLLLLFLLLRHYMIERLGGMTGDTAGAMLELLETSALLLFIIF